MKARVRGNEEMMNEDLDAPWDPDPLEVGTPVRIRLSGECQGKRYFPGSEGEIVSSHRLDFDGMDGMVSVIDSGHETPFCLCIHDNGHVYLVALPKSPAGYPRGECYTRTELERMGP